MTIRPWLWPRRTWRATSKTGPIRARQLALIFKTLAPFKSAIFLGDFNFGDGEEPETSQLNRGYTDLWLALQDGEPGFTWNIEKSEMARKGSFVGERSRRLDRILLRSKRYKPATIRIIGDQAVAPEIFPSDHFGLVATIAR